MRDRDFFELEQKVRDLTKRVAALEAHPTPTPAEERGAGVGAVACSQWCGMPRSKARKLGAFGYFYRKPADEDDPPIFCSARCSEAKPATPVPTGAVCATWCGCDASQAPTPGGTHWMRQDEHGRATHFCSRDCYYNERPVNPAPPTCRACRGTRRDLSYAIGNEPCPSCTPKDQP